MSKDRQVEDDIMEFRRGNLLICYSSSSSLCEWIGSVVKFEGSIPGPRGPDYVVSMMLAAREDV